ncbi:putative zinc-type alcohol dehydrogenase-like protein [Martensiomyces pterosporus]|nr:putative zinc-type alcohol dehydrogenase-like protein [Martensiomyces pterosporus]
MASSAATSNLTYRLTKVSSYDAIQQFEEAIPEIGDHEVLVKVKAVTLNYRDLMISRGTYPFPTKDQVVPASDAAGEVVKVGAGVHGFRIGDKVTGNFDPTNIYNSRKEGPSGYGGDRDGVLRQYHVYPAIALLKVPADTHLSWEQIASLPCAAVTAWNALFGGVSLRPGQTVLLQGTGGVSVIGLILARAAGASTIITSSSDAKLEYAKNVLGADYTINYKTHPNWEDEVLKITNGQGADFILEVSGFKTITQSFKAISLGGTIAQIGALATDGNGENANVPRLALTKGATLRGILIGSVQQFEELIRFIHARKLEIPVDKTFGFSPEEVQQAFAHLESQKHIGKIAIRVD